MSLEIDHAALISAGFRKDGSDLAVVWHDNGMDSLLNRALDPASAWGLGRTKLWFSLPSPLSAGATSQNRYFLVLGDPGLPGTNRPKQVFLTYDSFDGPTLDTTAWNVHASSEVNSSGQDVSNGQLRLWSRGQGVGSYSQIQSTATWQSPGVRMESQVATRGGANQSSGGCSRERILGAWSQNDDRVRGALVQTQTGLFFESLREPSTNQIQLINGASLDTNSHRVAINWQGEVQDLYRDQVHLGGFTGAGIIKTPNATPMMVGMGTSAFGGFCEGIVSELLVDWILVRPLVTPEPTASVAIP